MTNPEIVTVKCIHNNEVKIKLVLAMQYWSDGAHLEVDGCELCIKEIEKLK